jgi:hypothetical protein
MILPHLNDRDIPKHDEEVIEELQSRGIRVVYKPVAIIPNMFDTPEMDIHEALRKLKIREEIFGDPFS